MVINGFSVCNNDDHMQAAILGIADGMIYLHKREKDV
jgi:hypothetical protein